MGNGARVSSEVIARWREGEAGRQREPGRRRLGGLGAEGVSGVEPGRERLKRGLDRDEVTEARLSSSPQPSIMSSSACLRRAGSEGAQATGRKIQAANLGMMAARAA